MNYESRKTIKEKGGPKLKAEAKQKAVEEEVVPRTEQVEDLDLRTLSLFKVGHIDIPDMADFDPDEALMKIKDFTKHLSKENSSFARAALIKEFHEKLGIFRKNVAKAQWLMEDMLNQKPNSSSGLLRSVLKEVVKDCSVQALEEDFNTALNTFLEIRAAIKSTVRDYKKRHKENWQNKLFEDLFGKAPKGRVRIEIMPANIFFRLYSLEDYAIAYLGPELKGYNEDRLRASGGAKLHRYFNIPGLTDAVLLENVSVNFDNPAIKERMKIHEEEHTIHSFFPTSAMFRDEWYFLSLAREATTADLIKSLREYGRYYDQIWKEAAKSEVLAYWKAEQFSSEEIHEILLKKGHLYDYFGNSGLNNEYEFPNEVVKQIKKIGITVKDSKGQILSEKEIHFTAWEVITQTWETYKRDVTRALNAVAEMERMYGNSPESRRQILRLLSQEPLEKWGRLVRVLS